jgi:hypothetical protein
MLLKIRSYLALCMFLSENNFKYLNFLYLVFMCNKKFSLLSNVLPAKMAAFLLSWDEPF